MTDIVQRVSSFKTLIRPTTPFAAFGAKAGDGLFVTILGDSRRRTLLLPGLRCRRDLFFGRSPWRNALLILFFLFERKMCDELARV